MNALKLAIMGCIVGATSMVFSASFDWDSGNGNVSRFESTKNNKIGEKQFVFHHIVGGTEHTFNQECVIDGFRQTYTAGQKYTANQIRDYLLCTCDMKQTKSEVGLDSLQKANLAIARLATKGKNSLSDAENQKINEFIQNLDGGSASIPEAPKDSFNDTTDCNLNVANCANMTGLSAYICVVNHKLDISDNLSKKIPGSKKCIDAINNFNKSMRELIRGVCQTAVLVYCNNENNFDLVLCLLNMAEKGKLSLGCSEQVNDTYLKLKDQSEDFFPTLPTANQKSSPGHTGNK